MEPAPVSAPATDGFGRRPDVEIARASRPMYNSKFPRPVRSENTSPGPSPRANGADMKDKIHPSYHDVKASCACGASFQTRSTRKELRLEVCSNCHPFYTGKQHFVDSAGMVEKFQRKYGMKVTSESAAARN